MSHIKIAENRRKGYFDTLNKYNINIDKSLLFDCDTYQRAKEITESVLSSANPPDAIFAMNDNTAAGIIYIAKRMNISIPEQFALCGFVDGYISENTDPSITSVDQNPFLIGKYSASKLLHRIKNFEINPNFENLQIQTSLVLRASTGYIQF